MELQPIEFRLKGGGGGCCPLKAHFIQGAGDLLGVMTWPLGHEGSARLLSTDASALVGGARFNVQTPLNVERHFRAAKRKVGGPAQCSALSDLGAVFIF